MKETKAVFIVHHKLPLTHSAEDVNYFKEFIIAIGKCEGDITLFANSAEEGGACKNPGC